MRLIRRHLSTATHHKKSRRLIVDPGGSAVRSKTVRSCRFYSRPAAKPLRSRPPILRRKVARARFDNPERNGFVLPKLLSNALKCCVIFPRPVTAVFDATAGTVAGSEIAND